MPVTALPHTVLMYMYIRVWNYLVAIEYFMHMYVYTRRKLSAAA